MRRVRFFLRLFVWFSLRHNWRHRKRLLAVLVGLSLGAAVFTSVRLAIDASLDSFNRGMDAVSGGVDWTVMQPGGRLPEALVARLLRQPTVRTAAPVLASYVEATADPGRSFLLIGFDPILDRPLRPWDRSPGGRGRDDGASLDWMELIRTPYTLIAGPRLSAAWGIGPGQSVTLEHLQGNRRFQLIGTLPDSGLALMDGGLVAVTDIATMQEFCRLQGWVDRIDLKLRPGAGADAPAALRRVLPPGVELVPPNAARDTGNLMIQAYQLNLSVLSFVSLFVGMFLVYSLIALNAASRRRELAILSSIGASPRTLFALFVGEGALLGTCGWLAGIPLGAFMVRRLLGGVSATISLLFARVRPDRLTLSPKELLLSFLVTVGVAVLAAYQPAREAMAVAPREAMEQGPASARRPRLITALAWSALALIGLVWPLCRLPSLAGVPLFGYLAIFSLFAGFALVAPAALRLLGRVPAPVLRRLGGQPAFLAGRAIRDAGAKTAISVGALITAVALFVALVVMVNSFRGTVAAWVDQTVSGDLFVRAAKAGDNEYRDPLPEAVVNGLKGWSDQVDMLPYRRFHLNYGSRPYQFEVLDFEVFFRHGRFLMLDGEQEAITEPLARGEGVLVSEVFANQTGLGVGDRFQTQVEGEALDLPILGRFRDYRTRGGVVYYALQHFQQPGASDRWGGVRLFFKDRAEDLDGRTEQLRRRVLDEVARGYQLEVTSGMALRREILRIFDQTFAITTVLLLIALIIAALGISTTLMVLVLERRTQLNTLLAIGAAKSQVRRMLLWEALLIVIAGSLLGLLCGLVLAVILIEVINRQSFGWTFLFLVDWPALLAAFPIIVGAALTAVLPAVRSAFTVPPAMLLREE